MKKLLLGTLLVAVSSAALAEAPGGPNCGWGNMLFKGQRGMASHFVASTTNGTSGNATFGMTSGTNGCSTNGTLTYGGKPMLVVSNMMDELSEDMAKGQGEALTTYAVVLGVAPQDRAYFDGNDQREDDHAPTEADRAIYEFFDHLSAPPCPCRVRL